MTGSWRTGVVGYIGIVSGVMGFIADIVITQGMPQTLPEYFVFGSLILGGVGSLLAKDAKVSNAKDPQVEATDVPTVKP